jgi:hypothetical protein
MDHSFRTGDTEMSDTEMSDTARHAMTSANFNAARFSGH